MCHKTKPNQTKPNQTVINEVKLTKIDNREHASSKKKNPSNNWAVKNRNINGENASSKSNIHTIE